jgi:hypothetical protein
MIISLGALVSNNTTENKNKDIRYEYLSYEEFCSLLSGVYRLTTPKIAAPKVTVRHSRQGYITLVNHIDT